MPVGSLQTVKHRSTGFGPGIHYFADDELAARMPALALPPMPEGARPAFRAAIAFLRPTGNGCLAHLLGLAQARGYSADPRDWVPDAKLFDRFPALYQPWVDFFSEEGFTPFNVGNRLTADNWKRWKPQPRNVALSRMVAHDPAAFTSFVATVGPTLSPADRLSLLNHLGAGASHSGIFPWQVPLIRRFLDDPAAKIRERAQARLDSMGGVETEADHATILARHLTVENGRVRYAERPEPHSQPFIPHWRSTSFAALATALGLTPVQLMRGAELDLLDGSSSMLAVLTGDRDVKDILAKRELAEERPAALHISLFTDADPGLRRRGLEALFGSPYWNNVQELLDPDYGSLPPSDMHLMSAFAALEPSVVRERKERKLPVNTRLRPALCHRLFDQPGRGAGSARSRARCRDEARQLAPLAAPLQPGARTGMKNPAGS
ncbi:hypothetical protein GGQ97_001223 [Sphingomonas kaistensis]|uniref:Uncharacterized protein n=1 Tax=Sphingomonas kaistensis TaxID=298708 RepID=A0A7X5Y5Z4_9SPHN|nr:DUF5691 domain-containing protein [Sphingomonas kaistensis]NJC05430.1 hypothetical protein [Sphingomonas kaistensis]